MNLALLPGFGRKLGNEIEGNTLRSLSVGWDAHFVYE